MSGTGGGRFAGAFALVSGSGSGRFAGFALVSGTGGGGFAGAFASVFGTGAGALGASVATLGLEEGFGSFSLRLGPTLGFGGACAAGEVNKVLAKFPPVSSGSVSGSSQVMGVEGTTLF